MKVHRTQEPILSGFSWQIKGYNSIKESVNVRNRICLPFMVPDLVYKFQNDLFTGNLSY